MAADRQPDQPLPLLPLPGFGDANNPVLERRMVEFAERSLRGIIERAGLTRDEDIQAVRSDLFQGLGLGHVLERERAEARARRERRDLRRDRRLAQMEFDVRTEGVEDPRVRELIRQAILERRGLDESGGRRAEDGGGESIEQRLERIEKMIDKLPDVIAQMFKLG